MRLVSLLVAQETIDINATNEAGETAMHCALTYHTDAHAAVVAALLAHGAAALSSTLTGEGPLHLCAREGNCSLARKLLGMPRAGLVNAVASDGATPLHTACEHDQRAMVAALLENEACDRTARDAQGFTAVHLAVANDNKELLRLLLRTGSTRCTVDELRLRNRLGWCPLHTAAFRATDTAVQALLEAGLPADTPSADGATALHLATSRGHLGTVRLLLESGCSVDARQARTALRKPLPTQTDTWMSREPRSRRMARQHSRWWRGAAIVILRESNPQPSDQPRLVLMRWLLLAVGMVSLLVEYRAAVLAENFSGWTALHSALWQNNHPLARALLASGSGATAPALRGGARVLPAGEPEAHAPAAVKHTLLQQRGIAEEAAEVVARVGVY